MALQATLSFNSPINASCKVGDHVYHTATTTSGGFTVVGDSSNQVIYIGTISSTSDDGITFSITIDIVNESTFNNIPTTNFIFFSKNNLVETSSLTGYYAETTFVNNSIDKAELYAASCEVEESSK